MGIETHSERQKRLADEEAARLASENSFISKLLQITLLHLRLLLYILLKSQLDITEVTYSLIQDGVLLQV